MSKSFDYTVTAPIEAEIIDLQKVPTKLKGNPMLGFLGTFSVNPVRKLEKGRKSLTGPSFRKSLLFRAEGSGDSNGVNFEIPDYKERFYKKATKEFTENYIFKIKEFRKWLIEKIKN